MKKIATLHRLKDEILFRLYNAAEIDEAVEDVLAAAGQYFNVDRAYVFENSEDDLECSNTYEWCNTGIEPQKDKLQHLRYLEDLDGYGRDTFDENGMFFCLDVKTLPPNQQAVLKPQNVYGMLQCALLAQGEFKGYIGFDNCSRESQGWQTNEDTVEALVFVSRLLSLFLLEQRNNKRLIGKLSNALTSVQEANQAKTEFFARMSHDMRTPMNGIMGLAALSENEKDVDVLRQNIFKIKTSGNYLLALINDTLDFQKIESGKMKLDPQIIQCDEFIDSLVQIVRMSAEEKKIDFQVDVDEAGNIGHVRLDPVRAKQICLNLLSNAIKFTPENGQVKLEIKRLGMDGNIKHILVRVSDNGIGMSKEFLEKRIFQSFSQEYNPISAQYAGSGLGLSIVKKLVEMMGGTITVESTLGKGSVFTVYMDIEQITDARVNKAAVSGVKAHQHVVEELRDKKVLLFEDHVLNAEITKRILAKVGCQIDWAENGERGVCMFEESAEGTYDAILMDIHMPVMDGLTAAAKLRSLERPDAVVIPIIAMTANAYDDDVKKSLDAGMNDHLAKPIEPQRLYEILAYYIRTAQEAEKDRDPTKILSTCEHLYMKSGEELLKHTAQINMDTLNELVEGVKKGGGALSVEFDAFHNIYQFLERNLARTGQELQIVLLSVRDEKGRVPEGKGLEENYGKLVETARHSLRGGDLLLEFNIHQLAILLVNCNRENGQLVSERILDAYNKVHSKTPVFVDYEIRDVRMSMKL